MLRLFARHPVAFCGMLLLDVWSCCEKFVEVQTDTIYLPTLLAQQCWELLHPFARRLFRLLKAVFFFFNESLRKLLQQVKPISL